MNRYVTISTYSLCRDYSPGILQYVSPVRPALNTFGAKAVAGSRYAHSEHQRRAERLQPTKKY